MNADRHRGRGLFSSRTALVVLSVVLALLACLAVAGLLRGSRAQTGPRNIIILIGDGMGPEQVAAAGMYQYGQAGALAFEQLPHAADMTTYSASSTVTDSAAAASAMATGVKVNNGIISMAYPGDGRELETSLEFFQDRCKSAGLVTSVYLTHATPAGWGAHEPSRNNYSQIAQDYLGQTRPNVILGGGGNGLSGPEAKAAGYAVVTDRAEMLALDTESETMVSGQFTTGALGYEWEYSTGQSTFFDTYPHLSEMTQTALDILDNDPDGFFLMVEGGLIDWAGHSNYLEANIFETLELDNAFQVAWDWAQGRDDTLILVTADHETGGLTILQNNGQGAFPTVSWSSGSHTATNVPVYAWGPNAAMVTGTVDNTDIYEITVVDAGSPLCGASTSRDLSLSAGWNLVSWPLAPESTTLSDILDPLEGACDEVWVYDAWDDADPWKRWPGDLVQVDEAAGLWLHLTGAAVLTIHGLQPIGTAIDLRQGQNLVGYPSETARPVAEALASIAGKYTEVRTFDPGDASDPWKTYNASAPAYANDLATMQPGWGYWIEVTEDCTWTFAP